MKFESNESWCFETKNKNYWMALLVFTCRWEIERELFLQWKNLGQHQVYNFSSTHHIKSTDISRQSNGPEFRERQTLSREDGAQPLDYQGKIQWIGTLFKNSLGELAN